MGTVAFQSFHSYIVSKIKTTAHDNPKSNYYATKAEWIDSKTSIDKQIRSNLRLNQVRKEAIKAVTNECYRY